MTRQSAMSTASWESNLESLSDLELEEWLLFKDEIIEEKVNSPSLKSIKCETVEQVLHEIEDLGKIDNDYWLEEFPLFHEIETLTSFEHIEPHIQEEIQNLFPKLNEGQISGNVVVKSEIQKHSPAVPDLFNISFENSTTFFTSNDSNIVNLSPESCGMVPSVPSENSQSFKRLESSNSVTETDKEKSIPNSEAEIMKMSTDIGKELKEVDEIIKNTVLEIDLCESDSSMSEVSSVATLESSPEIKDDISDPEWKPEPLTGTGNRKHQTRRSKSYRRCGSLEDKKLRKKEQNKNAATRYRQKKKAEVSEILREEEELRMKKMKLEEKVVDIQNEIKCLKGLMRDLFKAKGLIK